MSGNIRHLIVLLLPFGQLGLPLDEENLVAPNIFVSGYNVIQETVLYTMVVNCYTCTRQQVVEHNTAHDLNSASMFVTLLYLLRIRIQIFTS